MKKIILVQINYSEDHSEKILPLGILAIGTVLKKNGFEIELINITEKEINETALSIVKEDPLYVGISVMTGMQTEHSALLSKKIKAASHGQVPIVWGGIHPSLLPQECLTEDYIDFVVISEGEITILEFTKKLVSEENLQAVLGIGYKRGSEIIINESRPFVPNLDEYRLDFSLLDLEKFIFPLAGMKRVIIYKASRGCPFNCAFCYNLAFNKRKWRCWSVETVLEDINYFKENYQIDGIKFYDDNFFVSKKRALEILEKIGVPAHVEIRIDSIDEALAKSLAEYKVFDMLIGVESGSNRLLELIDKKFTVDRTIEAVKILAKYKLPATYSAILGLPTETKEEFDSTVALMYKIYKIHPQSAFTLGAYLPYPGSRMYQLALKLGFKAPTRTEDWGRIDRFRKNFKSPWVNAKKVWVIRECFKFLNWKIGPAKRWFEFRIKKRFFSLPVDIYFMEFLSGIALEQKGPLGKLMRRIYNRLNK